MCIARARAPQAGDAEWLATRLRAADVAECLAAGHTDLRAELELGLARSLHAWCVEVDGEPAALFGVAPARSLLDTSGIPWLLGSDTFLRAQRAFIRHAPDYIDVMLRSFSHLLNYVHADNRASVRWLKRVGFALAPAAPYGPHGALFHRFEMHRHAAD